MLVKCEDRSGIGDFLGVARIFVSTFVVFAGSEDSYSLNKEKHPPNLPSLMSCSERGPESQLTTKNIKIPRISILKFGGLETLVYELQKKKSLNRRGR